MTNKFAVKIIFLTLFLDDYFLSIVSMINQSFSNKKRVNIWYQNAIHPSNQRTKFIGFTMQTYGFARLTRWCREIRKGVLEELINYSQLTDNWFCLIFDSFCLDKSSFLEEKRLWTMSPPSFKLFNYFLISSGSKVVWQVVKQFLHKVCYTRYEVLF